MFGARGWSTSCEIWFGFDGEAPVVAAIVGVDRDEPNAHHAMTTTVHSGGEMSKMMDGVPDMDELLNELEATENSSTVNVKHSGDSPATIGRTVILLQDSSNGFGARRDEASVDRDAGCDENVRSAVTETSWKLGNIAEATGGGYRGTVAAENVPDTVGDAEKLDNTTAVMPENSQGLAKVCAEGVAISPEQHSGTAEVSIAREGSELRNTAKRLENVANSIKNVNFNSNGDHLNGTFEKADSHHDIRMLCDSSARVPSSKGTEENDEGTKDNSEIECHDSMDVDGGVGNVDSADGKEKTADGRNRQDDYSELVLRNCNIEDDNFEKLCSKVANEVDRIAERYAEMEQYLAGCGTDNTLGSSEQRNEESDTAEILRKFEVQATEPPVTVTAGETDPNPPAAADRTDCGSVERQPVTSDSKPADERQRNNKLPEKTENAAAVADSFSLNDSDEIKHDIAVNAGRDSDSNDTHVFIGENKGCVEEQPSSICCHRADTSAHGKQTFVLPISSKIMTISGDESGEAASKRGQSGNEEGEAAAVVEGEEQMENGGSDDSSGECETTSPETEMETRAVSVVSSTYDISRDSDIKYLTESERRLGKEKPLWIADKETLSCMLCCTKFTVFVRRHHCRCCGRVLCAQCTTLKASLPYTNDPSKEHRVCDPCFGTLKRIEEYEKNMLPSETNSNECDGVTPSNASVTAESSRATKPALKSRSKPEPTDASFEEGPSSSDATNAAVVATKRTVIFRDGVHPGDSPVSENDNVTAATSTSKPKKHSSKRQQISRRLKQLHIAEECVCLLPDAVKIFDGSDEVAGANGLQRGPAGNSSLRLRNRDGTIVECGNIWEQTVSLRNFEPIEVMIFRNLLCTVKLCRYEGKHVMCIASQGMSFVGLDEIFLAYYCDAERANIPINCLWRIYEIYQNALTPQNESSDEELGIRPAQTRVPALNQTTRFANSEEAVARDILLFRPSVQNFENLFVPSSPFLVAAFVYQSESIWANVIPQRLLLRLGLQASFYPTPIINDFDRHSVYQSIFDTTVLKMFNDFRNWRFRMPLICDSTLTVRDNNESVLIIPTWANDEISKLIKANKNMIAWGLDFNADADSHLVSEQDETGSFDSQIFTNGIGNRKLTGASFVVIDGALKGGDESLTVSVLEDGVTVRLRSDLMESLIESLLSGQDFEQNSPAVKFSIKWEDRSSAGPCVWELVSPIDGRSLTGCYEYGLKKSRILGSFYPIPGNSEWSIRLVSVYNVAKGRFAQLIQSKVFAISEQITAQVALTLAPFASTLAERGQRQIFFRVRVSTDDAEYKTLPWPSLEQEFATWIDLVDNQVVPGLFSICSYVTVGFHAELHMALISIRANP